MTNAVSPLAAELADANERAPSAQAHRCVRALRKPVDKRASERAALLSLFLLLSDAILLLLLELAAATTNLTQ